MMLFFQAVYLFLSLFCVCEALHINTVRGYMGEGSDGKLHRENSTSVFPQLMPNDSRNTQTHTSGFLKTNTFDSINDKWIRAQVWAIGSCFKEGNKRSSAKIAQVTVNSLHAVGVTCLYDASDCSGDFFITKFTLPVVQLADRFESTVSHVPEIESALQIDSGYSDGLIVT